MITIHTNKLGALVALLCMSALSAAAASQEYPRAELFGGYQFTRIGGAGGVNANGWNAAITGNVNRWFGLTADFSGAYKGIGQVNAKAHTYTFGPTFALRRGRVTAFAHVLFGGFHASAGFGGLSTSTNGFTMMAGGGVDASLTPHVSVRVFQTDWLLWRTMGVTERKNARVSTGLVFCF
ncbi:MAG TPA: outer membrane beta-barrel protein [Bryobacteraceae bacterium]|nr:outer membrane beta-barrel protein [Bryobacteraceae bacterium]